MMRWPVSTSGRRPHSPISRPITDSKKTPQGALITCEATMTGLSLPQNRCNSDQHCAERSQLAHHPLVLVACARDRCHCQGPATVVSFNALPLYACKCGSCVDFPCICICHMQLRGSKAYKAFSETHLLNLFGHRTFDTCSWLASCRRALLRGAHH